MAKTKTRQGDAPGRFAYEGLDRIIHEKARLGIIASLATHPGGLLFNDLKELCSLTDGNLSRHLDVLAEAGLIEIHKGYEGRRPQTRINLTRQGRKRFLAYLAELERVVQDARAEASREADSQPGWVPGWPPASCVPDRGAYATRSGKARVTAAARLETFSFS